MNLLHKFKYAIFLSSYFTTLVLTKKNMCLQNCLPNAFLTYRKLVSSFSEKAHLKFACGFDGVSDYIYINFFLSFG